MDMFEEPEVGRKPATWTAVILIRLSAEEEQCSFFAARLPYAAFRVDVGKFCVLDVEQICERNRI